jgi:hypothetical protein
LDQVSEVMHGRESLLRGDTSSAPLRSPEANPQKPESWELAFQIPRCIVCVCVCV